MQIDCEVLNTRLINIKHGSIPKHMRPHHNHSQTKYANMSSDMEYGVNSSSTGGPQLNVNSVYKPYFMRKSYLKKNVKQQKAGENAIGTN